jgi:hypothetical protein
VVPGGPELPFDGAFECLTGQVPGAQPHRERRVVGRDEILDPGPVPGLRGLGLARPEVAEQHHDSAGRDIQDLDLVEVRRQGSLVDLEHLQANRPARLGPLLENHREVIRAQRGAGTHELEEEVPHADAALLRPTLTQLGSVTIAERRRDGRVSQLDQPQRTGQVVVGGRPVPRRGRQGFVEPSRQRSVYVLDRPGEFLGGDGLEPLAVGPPPAREVDPARRVGRPARWPGTSRTSDAAGRRTTRGYGRSTAPGRTPPPAAPVSSHPAGTAARWSWLA